MKLRTVGLIVSKEVSIGPRGLMFVFIVFFPFVLMFLMRLVFGGLFAPPPRLGVVDAGRSLIVSDAAAQTGIRVTAYTDEATLRAAVTANDQDAGLVLPAGFDDLVRSGARPPLDYFVSARASQIDQMTITVSLVDAVRSIAGDAGALDVKAVRLGDAPPVPLQDRMMPLLVLVAVAFSGIFLPASSIVQEREQRTLHALLVTPTDVTDVLAAKGIVGFVIGFGVGLITLLIGAGFDARNWGIVAVLVVAALMCVETGLMLGSAVSNMTTLFSVWKGGALLLFAPALLFLFPSVPGWIARIFPTFYFLGPLYEMTVNGSTLRSQLPDLGIGLVICAVLLVAIRALGRRMEHRLAAE